MRIICDSRSPVDSLFPAPSPQDLQTWAAPLPLHGAPATNDYEHPLSQDASRPDTYYGVPLADLLARLETMANRFFRQHGRWEPLSEYLSAGALAIAESLAHYDPRLAAPGGFKGYTIYAMEMRMRGVRYAAAGSNNMPRHKKGQRQDPKYTVESFDHDILYALRAMPATQETTTYLHEIVEYLDQQGKPAAMLLATVDEEPPDTIAERWGCTEHNVHFHCKKMRQRLRAWASRCT